MKQREPIDQQRQVQPLPAERAPEPLGAGQSLLGNAHLGEAEPLAALARGGQLLAAAGIQAPALVPGQVPLSVMREMMRRGAEEPLDTASASQGIRRSSGHPLPEAVRQRMEAAFGHDFSHVRIHTDGAAAEASVDLHALAFALGSEIFFAPGQWQPGSREGDELLAHELTHVVQFDEARLPSSPQGMEVSSPSDPHEREAERMAERVVGSNLWGFEAGELDGAGLAAASEERAAGPLGGDALSRAPKDAKQSPRVADAPKPRPTQVGFIDADDGANVRTGPQELKGALLTPTPLPPATAVVVTGVHPRAPEWLYVTTHTEGGWVAGYVQYFRVNTTLPEPNAKLVQIQPGDTVEGLAVQMFKSHVEPGKDLRFYENVVLRVNQDAGRTGVKGTYQEPGLLGGGSNNIQLEAGRRIWLPSPGYALSMSGAVPDGSLSNGLYGRTMEVATHLNDLTSSALQSWRYLDDVGLEVAAALWKNKAKIAGVVAAFMALEAVAGAAAGTGAGVPVAVLIEGILAGWLGGMAIESCVEAIAHGEAWVRLAWSANGDADILAEASKAFLRMLVALAMAALAASGVNSSLNKASAFSEGASSELANSKAGTFKSAGDAFSTKLPKSWNTLNPATHDAFKLRLKEVMGKDPFDPIGGGREGKVFPNDAGTFAFKRWNLKSPVAFSTSVQALKQLYTDVSAAPEIGRLLEVPKVYEQGLDWILKDFYSDAVPLAQAGSGQALKTAMELTGYLESVKGQLTPLLNDVLTKLKRPKISENLMWSDKLQKIIAIDPQ